VAFDGGALVKMGKIGISQMGIEYVRERVRSDLKFRREYNVLKKQMKEFLSKLLEMSKKELFDEVHGLCPEWLLEYYEEMSERE
jgi:hypothetical protein